MRLWRRRPRHVHVDLSETPESKAKKRAEAQWAEVHAFVKEQRELRLRNHFAERMQHAFREHP